ncbi:MAG: ATP-binding protein, partial [Desulfamplus sp.]|nr:ATP-binding protein [Desulfamplus sp.]
NIGDTEDILKYKRVAMRWVITDHGEGFDYTSLPDGLDPFNFIVSGRGIFLIRSFMDKITWNKEGNSIQMVKYLKKKIV